MTEDHLRHIEALAATLIKLDSIPHTSGYYKLASEYVPELIAEVRFRMSPEAQRDWGKGTGRMAFEQPRFLDQPPDHRPWLGDESEACE